MYIKIIYEKAIFLQIRAGLERKTSQSTLEKLAAIIEDFQNNDDLDQFKGLLLEVDEQDLNKYNCSGLSLLQKGCYESKTHLGNGF